MKKIFLIALTLFFLTGCAKQTSFVNVNLSQPSDDENVAGNASTTNQELINSQKPATVPENANNNLPTKETPAPETVAVPATFEMKVAFASQAPFANWDQLHEEACEEASMITAAKYFKKENLDKQIMENEIQRLVAWETANDYLVDLTVQETSEILKKYFGLNSKLVEEMTIDRIKYEVSQGYLIIVPAAGRELNNPNFKTPGPIYHMLVIRGYDSKYFITNDVGTRKGDGYKYTYQILINSVHDWNPDLAEGGMTDQEMATGRKVMIVIDGVNK